MSFKLESSAFCASKFDSYEEQKNYQSYRSLDMSASEAWDTLVFAAVLSESWYWLEPESVGADDIGAEVSVTDDPSGEGWGEIKDEAFSWDACILTLILQVQQTVLTSSVQNTNFRRVHFSKSQEHVKLLKFYLLWMLTYSSVSSSISSWQKLETWINIGNKYKYKDHMQIIFATSADSSEAALVTYSSDSLI